MPWTELDQRPDRTIYQTRPWLDFLVETQAATPVTAQVTDGAEVVGWFTGATIGRPGLRVLGSPLRGWTTSAMGFNLEPEVDRAQALAALTRFAFEDLRCLHLELADRSLAPNDPVVESFHHDHLQGYQRMLTDAEGRTLDDPSLLGAMTKHGRRDVRRAIRNGIQVEEVDHDDPDFAREYYQQVSTAFAKRGVTPTYPQARVSALMRHLGPTGSLLLLRARTPGGEPAATGIFPGLVGASAEFWMGAGDPRWQHLLANEALMWTAMRTWRDRGAVRLDFGGGGTYKAKYGGTPHDLPWLRRSKYPSLEHGRRLALELRRRVRMRRGPGNRP